jgi:hypothetical protein
MCIIEASNLRLSFAAHMRGGEAYKQRERSVCRLHGLGDILNIQSFASLEDSPDEVVLVSSLCVDGRLTPLSLATETLTIPRDYHRAKGAFSRCLTNYWWTHLCGVYSPIFIERVDALTVIGIGSCCKISDRTFQIGLL